MSYKASDWAWSLDIPKASAKMVLLNLAHHANPTSETVMAWPSVATIARETGLERLTVRRALSWLCEHRIIARIKDRFGRNGRGHAYVLACSIDGRDLRPKNGVTCFIGSKTTPSNRVDGSKTTPFDGSKTTPEQVSSNRQVQKEHVKRVHPVGAPGDALLRALSHGIAAR